MKISNSVIFSLIVWIILSGAAHAQEAETLAPQAKEREKTIAAKQTDVYRFALQKGEFAQIKVMQKGADLIVELLNERSEKIIERDSPNGIFGAEIISYTASAAGDYRVNVRMLDDKAVAGKYAIALSVKNAPDAIDLRRLAAEKNFQDALKLRDENKPESKTEAIKKFHEAAVEFAGLGDKYYESLAVSTGVFLEASPETAERSISEMRRAAQLAKEAADEYLEMFTTANVADVLQMIGQPEKARDIYWQVADRARRAKDDFVERYALNGLAGSYITAKDWKKVAEVYEQKLLPLARRSGVRKDEADWLNFTGVAYSYFDNRRAAEFYAQANKIYHDANNVEGEINTLQNLGSASSELGEKDKAVGFYRQAATAAKTAQMVEKAAELLGSITGILSEQKEKRAERINVNDEIIALYQKSGNRAKQAEYLNYKAVVLSQMDQHEKSLAVLKIALDANSAIDDKTQRALLLGNVANEYSWLGKKDDAATYYRQAADLQTAIDDAEAAVKSLEKLVDIYQPQKKIAEVLRVREEIVELFRKKNDTAQQAIHLNRIGVLYSDLNDRAKSQEYYQRALALAEKADNREIKAQIWHNIAAEHSVVGKYDEAIELYRKSLALRRELKLKAGEIQTLTNLSIALREYRRFDEALAAAKETVALARAQENDSLLADALTNLGNAYDDKLSDPAASIAAYGEALEIARRVKDKKLEADATYGLSLSLYETGETARSLETGRAAIELFRQSDDLFGLANALDHLAAMYSYLGQNKKAIEFLNETLVVAKRIGSPGRIGLTLSRLGSFYGYLEDYNSAVKYTLEALAYLRDANKIANETTAIVNLGEFYAFLDDYAKAAEYTEKGLQMSRRLGAKEKELGALHRFALIAYLQENPEQARDYLLQSLLLAREIKDRDTEASILGNLFRLEKFYGDKNLAIFYGKQSVNVNQELRTKLKGVDDDLQKSYVEKISEIYRNLADLLIEQGRIIEAQAVLDLLKKEEFGSIVKRGGEPAQTLPYSKAEETTVGLVEKLAFVGRELSELKAAQKTRTLSEAETKRLNDLELTEIPAANKALRQTTESLGNAAPDIKNALDSRMKDNIQTILPDLGAGVVALYTVFGQVTNGLDNKQKTNVGWILLVTPEFRKAYPIDTQDLNAKVAEFRTVLKSDVYDPQPLAQEIYKKLFLQTSAKQKTTLAADLETYLGKSPEKTLMWSLDGVLRYVPMAALFDGKQYLVEKYRNVVFNTASLGSLKDAAQADWKVLGLGVSESKSVKTGDGEMLNFEALKGAETELKSIVKSANQTNGILPGTVKMNKDFTKTALLTGVREGNPVVHIASHFSFNPANEEKSFLLLGDGTPLEMSEFEDFPNLFAKVDLLSLSACDTATGSQANRPDGDKTNGKEVEGFAYVAQTLGAKSVMASLWQVSDEGTKELMINFYRTRQANPQTPKIEALRQAQIALLKGAVKPAAADKTDRSTTVRFGEQKTSQPPYKKDAAAPFAHPYYWSPFILIGNWR